MCAAQTKKHFHRWIFFCFFVFVFFYKILLKNAVWRNSLTGVFEEEEEVEVQAESAIYSVISYSFKVERFARFQKHVNNVSFIFSWKN